MGYWGAGIYENDQAMDILSDEVARLAKEIDDGLGQDGMAWDDLDAPLVFVDLLAKIAKDARLPRVTPERVREWRQRYFDVYDGTIADAAAEPDFDAARRKISEHAFERLLSGRLSD